MRRFSLVACVAWLGGGAVVFACGGKMDAPAGGAADSASTSSQTQISPPDLPDAAASVGARKLDAGLDADTSSDPDAAAAIDAGGACGFDTSACAASESYGNGDSCGQTLLGCGLHELRGDCANGVCNCYVDDVKQCSCTMTGSTCAVCCWPPFG
jgi:hypothetical protein